MNREIKFRGKNKFYDNWFYGYLTKEKDKYFITENSSDFYQIDPKTIGQYTALIDKNGKEIYEGDIFHLGDPNITYAVVYFDTAFRGKQNGASSYVGLEGWKNCIEVIGNIYGSGVENVKD